MLFVCDQNFNRLGVIGSYSYFLWRKTYSLCGEAELHVDVSQKNINLLQKGNILYRQDDNEAMYIYYRQFNDSTGVDQLQIKCFSLLRWMDRRIVWGQFDFNATPENIIRQIINNSIINPTDTRRKIPQVTLSTAKNIGSVIQKQITNKDVYEVVETLCNEYEIGSRCLFNGRQLQYDFYQGTDRTINQSANPRIVLSKSRSNLLSRKFEDSEKDSKNTALIAGAGEGVARKTTSIGTSNSGLNRRELYIDAREISDKKKVGETEVIIPDTEYTALLTAKGNEKIAEYIEDLSFDCELDVTKENTKYNEDFFLGDLITIKDEELNLLMNSRVMQVDEVFQNDGKSIYVTVGNSVLTLPQAIKRMVR